MRLITAHQVGLFLDGERASLSLTKTAVDAITNKKSVSNFGLKPHLFYTQPLILKKLSVFMVNFFYFL